MGLASSIQAIRTGPLAYAPRGTIFSLHRIVPRDRLATLESNRTLELTPEELDSLIKWAYSKRYTLVSLNDLCESVRDCHRRESSSANCWPNAGSAGRAKQMNANRPSFRQPKPVSSKSDEIRISEPAPSVAPGNAATTAPTQS
jgi:hypothetical protein